MILFLGLVTGTTDIILFGLLYGVKFQYQKLQNDITVTLDLRHSVYKT